MCPHLLVPLAAVAAAVAVVWRLSRRRSTVLCCPTSSELLPQPLAEAAAAAEEEEVVRVQKVDCISPIHMTLLLACSGSACSGAAAATAPNTGFCGTATLLTLSCNYFGTPRRLPLPRLRLLPLQDQCQHRSCNGACSASKGMWHSGHQYFPCSRLLPLPLPLPLPLRRRY